jgi:hypothetical protein
MRSTPFYRSSECPIAPLKATLFTLSTRTPPLIRAGQPFGRDRDPTSNGWVLMPHLLRPLCVRERAPALSNRGKINMASTARAKFITSHLNASFGVSLTDSCFWKCIALVLSYEHIGWIP